MMTVALEFITDAFKCAALLRWQGWAVCASFQNGNASELMRLRWTDVLWTENRFLVHSPKTEQHEGHRERLVPLFPELREELEKHFLLDETKGNEFVVEHFQNTSWNLTTPFHTIARRAGLGMIVRPFDTMRMSRSNEVLARWGQAKESVWIGHSVEVMKDHYLCLSDSDYAEAGLEGQISHVEAHAKPTAMDGKMVIARPARHFVWCRVFQCVTVFYRS